MASIQRRSGPGYYSKMFGLLQGLQDGLQLLLTGIIIPNKINKLMFIGAPLLALNISLLV
jgi:NADH:ubiquinone oxidoreductase subunit H